MKQKTIQKRAENPDQRSPLWPLFCFTALYILVAVAGALLSTNREFLVYIAVMLVLVVLVWKVHCAVGLSPGALWGLSIWGCAHMAGGLLAVPSHWPVSMETPVLYNLWLIPGWFKYDQLIHIYGFAITTWVCWQGLRSALRKAGGHGVPTPGLLILAAAAGMGFGALNEVVEFGATLLVPDTNVGGYLNTSLDLLANFVGATGAAVLIWYFEGRGRVMS